MDSLSHYASPLGGITLASDGEALIGLWFDGQKYFGATLGANAVEQELPIFDAARQWLATYFAGAEPDFTPPLRPRGTAFQLAVWDALRSIPYGKTTTYGEIAAQLGRSGAAARAVGSAVGHNPISLIIPCHRVLGAGEALTGYAGGLDRKRRLLELEGNR